MYRKISSVYFNRLGGLWALGLILQTVASATPAESLEPVTQLTGIVPEPQNVWRFKGPPQAFTITADTVIVLDKKAGTLIAHGAEVLQNDLNRVYDLKVPIVRDVLSEANSLVLVDKKAAATKGHYAELSALVKSLPAKGNESYRLAADSRTVLIVSPAEAGTFYGIQTLRQMLRRDRTIPALAIADWPDQSVRMMYLTFPFDPKMMVEKMARMKLNRCIVESRWYAGGNWWYNPSAKNRGEMEQFFTLCRQNNIEPIPLVQGLGWAYGAVDINPNCAEGIWVRNESHKLTGTIEVNFNNPNVLRTPSAPIVVTDLGGMRTFKEGTDYAIIPGLTVRPFDPANRPWKIARKPAGAIADGQSVLVGYNYMDNETPRFPYCPSEPLTYRTVDEALTYVIKNIHPKYIHIGHDEVDYFGRCSRCQQYKQRYGKTNLDLIKNDLTHWFAKIKTLDPKITILMWDDLARPNAVNGPAIGVIPKDVILCTWVYEDDTEITERNGKPGELGEAGIRGDRAILNRLAWFIDQNHRKTIGVAAGFYPKNNWLWKEAIGQYRDNPNCLGYIYGAFNQIYLQWSNLGFAAQGMWSPDKLDKETFDLFVRADRVCRSREIGLNVGMDVQRAEFAKLVNDQTQAGKNILQEAQTLAPAMDAVNNKLKEKWIPELADDLVAPGIAPERVGTQINAFIAYYTIIGHYLEAQKFQARGEKAKAFSHLAKVAAGFDYWRFAGYEKAASWIKAYENENRFPSEMAVFGVDLKSAKSL